MMETFGLVTPTTTAARNDLIPERSVTVRDDAAAAGSAVRPAVAMAVTPSATSTPAPR
jgi:hypothetical protein